jgi:hypothetical protein
MPSCFNLVTDGATLKHKNKSKLDKSFKNALHCFQAAYFEGAQRYCRELETAPGKGSKGAFQIAWLSSLYSNGLWHRQDNRQQKAISMFLGFQGGQGMAEILVSALGTNTSGIKEAIEKILEVARRQNGVVISWYPSAYLRLATFARHSLKSDDLATRLVCIALSYRPVFANLDDVQQLGNLLLELRAPTALWADWCAIFVRHVSVCSMRPKVFQQTLGDKRAVLWACAEDARSEDVLRRLLAKAPPETHDILCEYAEQAGMSSFASVIKEKFTRLEPLTVQGVANTHIWWDSDAMSLRYFWYDMLTESEKNILRNGDWAMFEGPTPDYSMAVAQWWRVLESVLKRLIINPIKHLYAENPLWLEWDNANLAGKGRKRAEIFIEKLAVPERAEKMTLADLLMVLLKCVSDDEKTQESSSGGSKLRREATKYLSQYREHFTPLVIGSRHEPVLRIENIDYFRNRSSHNMTLTLADAATGRAIAKRLLTALFEPDLAKLGFSCTINAD